MRIQELRAYMDKHEQEFMDIAHLKECAVIFAEAILRLCTGESL